MSEEEFTELVNLYLDNEISPEELKRLRAELSVNREREARFVARRRLHEATRLALDPEGSSKGRRRSSRSRTSSKRRSPRHRSRVSRSAGKRVVALSASASMRQARVAPVPRWVLGSGMAASLLLAALLLAPVFKDSFDAIAIPGLVASDLVQDEPVEQALANIRASDLERFARVQQKAQQQRASLVAQMRLLGLRPEHTPADKQLRAVDAASLAPRGEKMSRAELLAKLQELKPIPEPQLLHDDDLYRRASNTRPSWGSGSFDVQLVGY